MFELIGHLPYSKAGFSLGLFNEGTNAPLLAAPEGHFDNTVENLEDIYFRKTLFQGKKFIIG